MRRAPAAAGADLDPQRHVEVNRGLRSLRHHLLDHRTRGVDIALVRDGLIATVYTLLLTD